jgi:Bacteriocin-protection, YdeI or OmpD-Associated
MDLLKKLRFTAGEPLWLINAPEQCLAFFDGFDVKKKTGKQKPVPQLMLFVIDSIALAEQLQRLADYIGHDTVFWICYPKKSGAIQSDLIMMKSWDILSVYNYRGQTSVSIDDDWSGLRVTNAPRKKASDCDIPMIERNAEGIDFVNRTVQLPADAEEALNAHKGLCEYFYSQSFTCKKEYQEAIIQAKKPETRTRRIEKMIEMLLPKMHAKQLKIKP